MELLSEIWSTARRNKLRTALTGFAVAWGIFMLIFLLGAGNGLIHAVTQNSDRFLSNSMVASGGKTSKAYDGLKEGRWIQLQQADYDATAREFPQHVDDVGAELFHSNVIVSNGENYISTQLSGVFPNHIVINKREMLHGRFINDLDMRHQRKVLVVSEDQAKELNPSSSASLVGRYVKIGDIAFQVIGIMKTDQSSMSSNVSTAFTTLRTMYNRGNQVGNIMFSFHGLTSKQANESFEKEYRRRLNKNHRAAPDDEESVWIWNRFTQNLQMNNGMNIIRTALWIIGIFTLLSGIVGVSNIMLITVKERTREFGIRKAIGAKPSQILRLIIIESIVITTFFGYIGMILGIAANQYMDATLGHEKVSTGLFEATMFVDPTVGIGVCVEATLVMIIAGTLAGLMPARKAAHIRPIEALRAE
ncbi:MAG: ABC transporter permease [Prevotella sp.]|nr:ABC transporter permease [Prevotella sp.]